MAQKVSEDIDWEKEEEIFGRLAKRSKSKFMRGLTSCHGGCSSCGCSSCGCS